MSRRSTMYAAAKTFRTTGNWSPVYSNINDIIALSAPSVRERIRQLVRDFPYFARACSILVDYTVGDGIVFQSRARRVGGALNQRAIQKIEDAFRWWSDEADIAGKLHFYEIQRLCKRQDVECGEFILVKAIDRTPGRFIPYALQMYEADWLTDIGARAEGGNAVGQGIEYDKKSGRVAAYHFADPDGVGKPTRVRAEDVIHGFETIRPGQLRGISPFAPGVMVTHDLQDIMDGEIDATKMAGKWLAFVYEENPALRQGASTLNEAGKRIEELENATIEYLRPGEKVELAANPRPGANFPPFVKLVLGMLSVATGAPYELLSGDYAGMNYSTMRVSRNDFATQLHPIASRHVRHLCEPVVTGFFDWAVLSGKLELPGYFTGNNARLYREHIWQPPAMEEVDPLRVATATEKALARNLMSPQEIVAKRGRDLEEVYSEIKAAKELRELYGLTDEDAVSVAAANNPAALQQDNGDEKDEKEK